ncbi:EF-hand domain-containing protein [Sphingomonas sp. CGMCC 1.13654]|uniref:EF-hand domain-containing protein n=1 Tax=Sphingomonas chungangi TaxID=2683589 RepID=A0A838LF56_9SPHN|nr:EF-hand domain-containing protein [Sphingomonas chungangi]MBA2936068.1 EF-hand domain-containing protein [Sphingomonas chungangi]
MPLVAAPEKKAPAKKNAAPVSTKPLVARPTPPLATGDITRTQMMAQIKKTFELADTNHDGFISRAEFAKRMTVILNRDAPPTKEDAQRMLDAANRAFNNVDANHDGKLSLSEASVRPLKAFDMMDTNHDGILTAAEKAAAHQDAPDLPANGPTLGQQQPPGR